MGAMMSMKPIYEHDCPKCQYVATVLGRRRGMEMDWYVCPDGADGGSVVGRQSNKDSDYWSMPVSMLDDRRYDETVVMDTKVHGFSETRITAQAMLQLWRQRAAEARRKETAQHWKWRTP